MKLWSNSFADGATIPERFAAGRISADGVGFSENLNPHLAWSEVPAATQSLVLVCHDPDVPSRGDDVNQADREVPAGLPRVDFFHWLLVDLPSTLQAIAEAEFSRGFTARGKAGPDAPHGARQGINDYTGWFAGNADMAGQYYGYDGPFPPFNDSLLHHYVFTLYAVAVPRLEIVGEITGAAVRQALSGQVLAQASITGVYTLNRRLLSGAGA
jgi:Raf kinase inhibitor-like YbhB/YbcL family protein